MLLKIQVSRTGLNDEIVLTSFPITIGRAPDNTLVLEDSWVSRHHAKIELEDNQFFLTDLGAANGVTLNNRLVKLRTPVAMNLNDLIGIGEYQLWLEAGGTQMPSAPSHWVVSPLPMPGLVVTMGEQVFHYPFDVPLISIGRNPDGDIVLDHPMVSRRHGEIHLESEKYVLYDVGSTNGFVFEGQPVTQQSLKDGDQFTIPGTNIRFEFRNHIGHLTIERPLRKELTLFRPKAAAAMGLLNLEGLEVITIGRAEDNRIVLPHPQIELHHAAIERSGSRYCVRDLNSLRGVYVNGLRIDKESWLHINDEIRVVGFRFALHETGLERLADEVLFIAAVGLENTSRKHPIDELSLCFGPDELVAVVGANASLRTSLIEALSGVRPASSGRLLINGVELYKTKDQFRLDIGYVPQENIVHPELSVNIALDFTARLRMLPNTSAKERRQRIDEVLTELGLSEQRNQQVSRLAAHQARRANLAVELLTRPRLLFLDEPINGLDPTESAEILSLLRKQVDQGRSVLLTASACQEIMLCDKVAILTPQGSLAFFGPPEVALGYFDQYKPADSQAPAMDFDQITSILANQDLGSDQAWKQRFLLSKPHQEYIANRLPPSETMQAETQIPAPKFTHPQTSFWRQLLVLTRRNFSVTRKDKFFLGTVLIVGPLVGALSIFLGSYFIDLHTGVSGILLTAIIMAALTSVLIGIGIGVHEARREASIFKRERNTPLYLLSYVSAKLSVGAVISIYLSLILAVFLYLIVLRGSPIDFANYGLLFAAILLGAIIGYLIGSSIRAVTPNRK